VPGRLYDSLFTVPEPDKATAAAGSELPAETRANDFKSTLNPHSLEVVTAKCEPAIAEAMAGRPSNVRYQFERLAYFALDKDSQLPSPNSNLPKLIFNRTITLKDAWAKEAKK
jgi:glutaminyl-tRNA synthetase